MPDTYPLTWDEVGEREYETGVDHVVCYPLDQTTKKYSPGIAWNGITAINENPSGAEATALYADNIKYLELRSAEQFGLTLEAYMYPPEFATLDGTAEKEGLPGVRFGQQKRGTFGLSYRTKLGNDVDGDDHGYKLHLVYGCVVSPSGKNYTTINDSPEAITFSWEGTTTPVAVTGHKDLKPVSTIVIDSTKLSKAKLTALEAKLYGSAGTGGSDASAPELPLPADLITLLNAVTG